MPLENNIWEFNEVNQTIIDVLVQQLNIEEVIAQILVSRKITSFNEAKQFFRPSDKDFLDPLSMDGMSLAISRLNKAFEQKENILKYGDYDVDGTCSVALLHHFSSHFSDNIYCYQPHREKEGYGISLMAIDWMKEKNIQLVIALDCGIKDFKAAKLMHEMGINLIICDHHKPGNQLPIAKAILNPKKENCNYNFKELCGCGIGFKFIQAYKKRFQVKYDESLALQLTAIATTADVVPLIGENRLIVSKGIAEININPIAPLKRIFSLYKYTKGVNASDLVFKIAPRINAAGRLAHAKIAVQFLLSKYDELEVVFNEIESLNSYRRELDEEITNEALSQLSIMPSSRFTNLVHSPKWHKGVIGIVASRIMEHYYKPTIVFSGKGDVLTGSARSIKEFDIYAVLEELQHHFVRFGGHKYAAGMSLKKENKEKFFEEFENLVASKMTDELKCKKLKIDSKLSLNQLAQNKNERGIPKIMRIIKQMEPFGPSNSRPVFCFKGLVLSCEPKIVGQKHLKFHFIDEENSIITEGIWFSSVEAIQILEDVKKLDVVATLMENHFNNQISIQLNIKDIKPYTSPS